MIATGTGASASANGSNKQAGVSAGGIGGAPNAGGGDRTGDKGGIGNDKPQEAAVKMCLDHTISLCKNMARDIYYMAYKF